MRYFIISLLLVLAAGTIQAQDANTININVTAEVLVPADKINFRINVNAEGETPKKAYELHQKQEKVLVSLLKEHEIQEKNINFNPISISRVNEEHYNSSGKRFVRTRQTVNLTLDDFGLYEEIQLTLIENDFDEFSGNFTSSEMQQGEEKALKKALKLAREKADIIANETGLTISDIKYINYSYNQGGPRPMMEMERSTSADLMDFEQSISVSANVSVTYTTK